MCHPETSLSVLKWVLLLAMFASIILIFTQLVVPLLALGFQVYYQLHMYLWSTVLFPVNGMALFVLLHLDNLLLYAIKESLIVLLLVILTTLYMVVFV